MDMNGQNEKILWEGHCDSMLLNYWGGHIVAYDNTEEELELIFILQ